MVNLTIKRKSHGNPKKGLVIGLEKSIEDITKRVEKEAIKHSPKDTGDLRGSIGSKIKRLIGTVFAKMPYAGFQEFGTYIMSAANQSRGYLRLALSKVRPKVPTIVGKHIRNEMRKK